MVSIDYGVPVASADWDTAVAEPGHAGQEALYVSTSLATWRTGQPKGIARDFQINDTCYRRLDPEYYAWLRSRMHMGKLAALLGAFRRHHSRNCARSSTPSTSGRAGNSARTVCSMPLMILTPASTILRLPNRGNYTARGHRCLPPTMAGVFSLTTFPNARWPWCMPSAIGH